MLALNEICLRSQAGLESITDPTIIKSLAQFEETINDAYQGRLFFELIQNARDAAYKSGINSKIKIYVNESTVYFGNTGAPFNESGITAMTRLGLSDKSDNKTIGHKGIGFKAIQEYTTEPKIITRYGTIYFEKSKLYEILQNKFPGKFSKLSEVPLFYYPHFEEASIQSLGIDFLSECETVIIFDLNKGKTIEEITDKFNKITNEELILLGNIESIEFQNTTFSKKTSFSYQENKVTVNDTDVFEIIQFKDDVIIPDDVFENLTEKEKDIFNNNREVDIKIVFELKDGKPVMAPASKLYLFYPLEISSGFNYKIHSYFSCNPQRTDILESALNDFIFDKIVELQTNKVIPYLKKYGIKHDLALYLKVNNISPKLKKFYVSYLNKLKTEKFIWVESKNDYFSPDQIIATDKEAYKLFRNYLIEDKKPLFIEEILKDWLSKNFNISILDRDKFRRYIEQIAEYEKHNPTFFSKLYKYAVINQITLTDKKVHLGEDNNLYRKENDVFLQGDREQLNIPKSIQNKIIMLHADIEVMRNNTNFINYTGLKQFSINEIVEKSLSLFSDEQSINIDILRFLFNIEKISDVVINIIRKKILIPVGETKKWLSPLFNPVYIETPELKELYPQGNFVNLSLFSSSEHPKLKDLLLKVGVWDIPAVYFKEEERIQSWSNSKHVYELNRATSSNNSIWVIRNDRKMDFPANPNYYFFEATYKNWNSYVIYLSDNEFLKFSGKSDRSNGVNKYPYPNSNTTSFGHQLWDNKWITIDGGKFFLQPSEVIGIDNGIYLNERNIKYKGINWLVLNYSENKSFFNELKIPHLNAYLNDDIIAVLVKVYELFKELKDHKSTTEFKKFYHTILKYVNTKYDLTQNELRMAFIDKLKSAHFLCVYFKDGVEYFSWQKPNSILHIDDNKQYQHLDISIKEQLGHFFTKSDKTEIGRVFNQIAEKLSNRIESKIDTSENISNEQPFLKDIKNLVNLILFVEDKTEQRIKPEILERIIHLRIKITDRITNCISIKNAKKEKIELPAKQLRYRYDDKKNVLYTSVSYDEIISDKPLLSEMINEIFSELLTRVLDYKLYFQNLLSSQYEIQQQILRDINYDPHRKEELEELLNDNRLNERQLLWNSILKAKASTNDKNPFPRYSEIKWSVLSASLHISQEILEKWDGKFNYVHYNAESNYNLIREILSKLEIEFSTLNDILDNKLNFEHIYHQQYERFKNQFSPSVKYFAYQSLLPQDEQAKQTFLIIIDAIEKLIPTGFNSRKLDFDGYSDLLKDINAELSRFELPKVDTLTDKDNLNWKQLLGSVQRRAMAFKRKIARLNDVNTSYIDDFLGSDENFSLLYFDKTDELVALYEKLYPLLEAESDNFSLLPKGYITAENDNNEITAVKLNTTEVNNNLLEDWSRQINPKHKTTGGGYHNPQLLDNNTMDNIGKEGERLLFDKLSEKYDTVKWVSAYAKDYGYKPDPYAVGYDMYYVDENNKTHYVEVKTSAGQQPEFHISINEIKTAMAHKEHYHIIWITNLFNKSQRKYIDLGNIFIDFKETENFFINSRFKPILTAFKIAFNPDFDKDDAHDKIVITDET